MNGAKISTRAALEAVMRTPLALLGLILGLVAGLALLEPATSHARCAMSPGDELVLLTTRAQGGVVLVHRRATRGAAAVLTGDAPTSLTLQREACARGCEARLTLAPLASNLYALRIPASTQAGRWRITTPGAGGTIEVGSDAGAPTPAISSAPASPRVGRQIAGSAFFVPTIELGAPAPAGAVGVLARWQGGSLFMPAGEDRTRFLLFPGRCRTPLPGYVQPSPGTVVELAFVDTEGRLSPSSRATIIDVSP